ncbi:MAG: hypothetical protein ACREV8_06520 [Gammaproteobacteria bacterium]
MTWQTCVDHRFNEVGGKWNSIRNAKSVSFSYREGAREFRRCHIRLLACQGSES